MLGGVLDKADGFYALLEKSWAKVAGGFLVIDDAPVCEGSDSEGSDSDSGASNGCDTAFKAVQAALPTPEEIEALSEEDMRLKLHEIAALCAPRAGNSTEPPLEEEQEEYQDVMPYQGMGYCPINTRGLHYGWQGSDKTCDGPQSKQDLFQCLLEWDQARHICCLSGMPRKRTDKRRKLGVVGGHDYSILEVRQA